MTVLLAIIKSIISGTDIMSDWMSDKSQSLTTSGHLMSEKNLLHCILVSISIYIKANEDFYR